MRESELKLAVSQYLEYGMNQGKWYFDRLNSGSILAKRGDKMYKVNLCREGTADFMVIQLDEIPLEDSEVHGSTSYYTRVIFLELKGDKGRQRQDQKEFQTLVEAQGSEYHIIRSIEELETLFSI